MENLDEMEYKGQYIALKNRIDEYYKAKKNYSQVTRDKKCEAEEYCQFKAKCSHNDICHLDKSQDIYYQYLEKCLFEHSQLNFKTKELFSKIYRNIENRISTINARDENEIRKHKSGYFEYQYTELLNAISCHITSIQDYKLQIVFIKELLTYFSYRNIDLSNWSVEKRGDQFCITNTINLYRMSNLRDWLNSQIDTLELQNLNNVTNKFESNFESSIFCMQNIYNLIYNSFSDTDLERFCLCYYGEVQSSFGATQFKTQKVIALIEFCNKNKIIGNLLDLMKTENTAQYQINQPYSNI